MKTLIANKSGGGFMKRILMAGAVVLLSLGATRPALATTAVELVTGNDIIYWDGSTLACYNGAVVACSTFGVTDNQSTLGGVVTLTIGHDLSANTFGGWTVSSDSGDSKSPSCDTGQVCEDQNQLNVVDVAGTAALKAYFASSGFNTAGPLDFSESASETDGTVTAKAYAYTGAIGLSAPTALLHTPPSLTGLFSTLSLLHPGFESSAGAVAPPPSYNLASELDFTAKAAGTGYNVTETISTEAAVPESSSVGVFLVMLLGIAFVVRKGAQTLITDPKQGA